MWPRNKWLAKRASLAIAGDELHDVHSLEQLDRLVDRHLLPFVSTFGEADRNLKTPGKRA
jgi:hypothetical protein